MASFTEKLGEIFLNASGIKESFDNAYETFVSLAEKNTPMPIIAKSVAPHLRPVVQQFVGLMGRAKLAAAAVAVNWKLSNVNVDEINDLLDKAKVKSQKDVAEQSKNAIDVAQKFVDGLSAERIQEALDANKGAVTQDMIEDVVLLVKAVKSVLPSKLDTYLYDLLPEIDDLEGIIRREAEDFVAKDSGEQVKKALDVAKEKAEANPDELLQTGQQDIIKKLEELEPEVIKRIIDRVGEDMTYGKVYNLMAVFFKFADEVLEAFEDSSIPLRDRQFKHGRDYQAAIAEFLQFVENALDAEGILPDHIDPNELRAKFDTVAGKVGIGGAPKNSEPKSPDPTVRTQATRKSKGIKIV